MISIIVKCKDCGAEKRSQASSKAEARKKQKNYKCKNCNEKYIEPVGSCPNCHVDIYVDEAECTGCGWRHETSGMKANSFQKQI